jgi:hypothetical protein
MANILQDFGGAQGAFPCRYLGLPLGFRKPRKIDVQPLFDSAVNRLKGWKGKLMSKKGRLTLINSVITSIATYFLMIFPAEKWMIKSFNKLRRNFLWTPDEEASERKCLVSWQIICAPTMYGGLGVKDIQAFSRALRLRWEWFMWTERDCPWVGSETPCDQSDKDLFASCTSISIGNGEIARFWSDRWLNGQAPRLLAPLCYNLAVRKNLTVKEALLNGRWMQGLQRMSNEEQIDQFIILWSLLRNVTLSSERDGITWHASADGKYPASSAYSVQFHGRIREPHLDRVWRVRAEGNAKFFLWLLLQNRHWTAERLRARRLPHDDCCCFCDQEFETAAHLAINCSFAKEVWSHFQHDNSRAVLMANRSFTLTAWWKKLTRGKKDARHKKDIMASAYIIWHIWKERGRQVFQNASLPVLAIVAMIKADLELVSLAKRGPEGVITAL